MFTDGKNPGTHMWNVVNLKDSNDEYKKYLVDMTDCDVGTMGADDLLFVKRADRAEHTYADQYDTYDSHYIFDCNGTNVNYYCNDMGLAESDYAVN